MTHNSDQKAVMAEVVTRARSASLDAIGEPATVMGRIGGQWRERMRDAISQQRGPLFPARDTASRTVASDIADSFQARRMRDAIARSPLHFGNCARH